MPISVFPFGGHDDFGRIHGGWHEAGGIGDEATLAKGADAASGLLTNQKIDLTTAIIIGAVVYLVLKGR